VKPSANTANKQAAGHRRDAGDQVDAPRAVAVGQEAHREQRHQEADVIGRLHHAGLPGAICQSVRSSGSTADQAVNMVAKAARAAQNSSSQIMGGV
jgi:hypothetical protein